MVHVWIRFYRVYTLYMEKPFMDCTRSRPNWWAYLCQTLPNLPGPRTDPPTQPRVSLGQSPHDARAPRHVDEEKGGGWLMLLYFRDLFPILRGRV